MIVYIVNKSTVLTSAQVAAVLPGLQHFAGVVTAGWGLQAATLKTSVPPSAATWQIVLLDDSDQAGALGYHDFTPGGRPLSKVFAKTDIDNGYSWTVTLTHELAEMLVDPWIVDAMQTGNTRFYAKEVGDPVEEDTLGWRWVTSDGLSVLLSDFVLPAWFIPSGPGPYDHGRHLTSALQVLAGGYAQYFDGGTWHQVDHLGAEVAMNPDDLRFRSRWKT